MIKTAETSLKDSASSFFRFPGGRWQSYLAFGRLALPMVAAQALARAIQLVLTRSVTNVSEEMVAGHSLYLQVLFLGMAVGGAGMVSILAARRFNLNYDLFTTIHRACLGLTGALSALIVALFFALGMTPPSTEIYLVLSIPAAMASCHWIIFEGTLLYQKRQDFAALNAFVTLALVTRFACPSLSSPLSLLRLNSYCSGSSFLRRFSSPPLRSLSCFEPTNGSHPKNSRLSRKGRWLSRLSSPKWV